MNLLLFPIKLFFAVNLSFVVIVIFAAYLFFPLLVVILISEYHFGVFPFFESGDGYAGILVNVLLMGASGWFMTQKLPELVPDRLVRWVKWFRKPLQKLNDLLEP